jgi:hypothetical protein
VAKALGDDEAQARHAAVFEDFHAALLRNVTANSVRISADYPSVVGMYPGFTPETAAGCCAWGGVDIIYPFPLVNVSSQTAVRLPTMFHCPLTCRWMTRHSLAMVSQVSSMEFWSSPARTDKYGLHLKLGYSEKVRRSFSASALSWGSQYAT